LILVFFEATAALSSPHSAFRSFSDAVVVAHRRDMSPPSAEGTQASRLPESSSLLLSLSLLISEYTDITLFRQHRLHHDFRHQSFFLFSLTTAF